MIKITITICPNCSSDKIKKVRRNWAGKYRDKVYKVPGLEYYECPNCGEQIYDREAMQKVAAHSPAYSRKQVKKTA